MLQHRYLLSSQLARIAAPPFPCDPEQKLCCPQLQLLVFLPSVVKHAYFWEGELVDSYYLFGKAQGPSALGDCEFPSSTAGILVQKTVDYHNKVSQYLLEPPLIALRCSELDTVCTRAPFNKYHPKLHCLLQQKPRIKGDLLFHAILRVKC